ncbi:MAG: LamG domain-containing protein [Candidatus Absconditabacteria bacterium]
MATKLKRYLKSFTLIELIIVIAIIAVLGATAFLLLTQWMSKGRDASKISSIRTIKTALEINFTAKGDYPIPQDAVEHTGVNGTKLYQGYVGANMVAELQKSPIDPTTKKPYVYSYMKTNSTQGYYQIGTTMENTVGYEGYNLAKADISTTAKVVGNYDFDPSLPSLIIAGGNESTRGIYDPSTCFVIDGGKNTVDGTSCQPKKELSLKDYDKGLVGYWDMESLTVDGQLMDISGNGNNGVRYTLTTIGDCSNNISDGIVGKSTSFIGDNYVSINYNINNLTEFSFSAYVLNSDLTTPAPRIFDSRYRVFHVNSTIGNFIGDVSHSSINSRSVTKDVIILNNYTHVAMTFSERDGKTHIYINGIKANYELNRPAEGIMNSTTNPLLLGNRANLDRYFKGIIDEVKIYNRVLSEAEILQQAKSAGF